jgi:hypothetical protein
MVRRLVRMVVAALLFAVGAIAIIGRLGRHWETRVAVRGHSMTPTLKDGDWLLVDPDAYSRTPPQLGDIVVARDPREPQRLLVKRIVELTGAGAVTLGSDDAGHAGQRIGPLLPAQLVGRATLRYWPLERFGRIGVRGA